MKKHGISLAFLLILVASSLNSCATYIAAVGTVSMTSSDENAVVDSKNRISSNEDIELKYDLPKQEVTLKNTSDATLVIDLAQSSYIDKDRISQPLYTGQIIETYTSATDAYGQSAAAARAVPNGVIGGNLSEAHSSTNSLRVTEQQQRYIILSPKTATKITLPEPHSKYSITGYKTSDYSKEYTPSDSPVSCEYVFSYWDRQKGENEGLKSTGNLFYLSKVSVKGNIKDVTACGNYSNNSPCDVSNYVKISYGLPIFLISSGVVFMGLAIYGIADATLNENTGGIWAAILGFTASGGCAGGGISLLSQGTYSHTIAVVKL